MEAFNLQAIITLDSKQFEDGLNNAEGKAKSWGSKVASGFGTAVKAVGAATVAVAGAAAGAVATVTKGAVDAYASYEQLVGGVQKLYGNAGQSLQEYAKSTGQSVDKAKGEWQKLEDAQNLVLKNAENAYKTSGMSMNEYMETATSFSAALVNSLGGDTKKAAEQTDIAMRAISDNVNTFGSDMESVQNAFQGFAKGNYTMLDNLKLGYGGTKEGMEQLIKDANEYGKSVGKASNLSVESFSDIVTAIELVQEKQGIAGTTAREAATTLEGSLTMTKAAWQNVLTALGTGDLEKISQNVIALGDSAATYIDNLIPVIENIFSALPDALGPIIEKLGAKLPEFLEKVLPVFMQLVGSIGQIIADAMPMIVNILIENLPLLLGAFGEIVGALASGLLENLPVILSAVWEFVKAAGTALINFFKDLLGIHSPSTVFAEFGLDIINGLLSTLKDLPARAMSVFSKLLSKIKEFARNIKEKAKSMGSNLVSGMWNGISGKFKWLVGKIKSFASNVTDKLKGFFGIESPSKVMRDQVGKYLAEGIGVGFTENMPYDDIQEAINHRYDIPQYDTDYEVSMVDIGNNTAIDNRLYSLMSDFFPVLLEAIEEQKEVVIDGRQVINYVDTELGKKAVQKGRGN